VFTQVRLTAVLALACFAWGSQARAEEIPPLPDLSNISTPGPGTYSNYLDFVRHNRWEYSNVPQPLAQDVAECVAGILYDLATPGERAIFDNASKGNGISAEAQADFAGSLKPAPAKSLSPVRGGTASAR
jgi:hypothetical protein